MVEIIPAILPQDFAEVEDKLEQIKGLSRLVQIDIMDGSLTEDSTWPYRKQDDNFESIINEDLGMPFWEDINFEFDLMVRKPAEVIENWIKAGASRIVLHIDSDSLEELERIMNEWGSMVEIGLALNIDTDVSILDRFLDKISFIQVMGIDVIGSQGHPFDPKVISKIKEIRAKTELPISVDGGVSPHNTKDLVEAGASRLIVGSFIWDNNNVNSAISEIKSSLR